jgi:hypothetical protein
VFDLHEEEIGELTSHSGKSKIRWLLHKTEKEPSVEPNSASTSQIIQYEKIPSIVLCCGNLS